MSLASQGRSREYRVRDHLVDAGWSFIMRAAASKGPADLLLGHRDHGPILIQVGTESKSLGPADRERFVVAAAACRAQPILATVTRAGIQYQKVNMLTPRWWQAWDPTTGRGTGPCPTIHAPSSR